MKIIFLDIDGVLNSDVYMDTEAYKEETRLAGCVDHHSYDVVIKAHYTHLDSAAIQLMNQLVDQSGAKVVLSSTWRIRYSLDEMNDMLKQRGATFQLIDKTPTTLTFGGGWSSSRTYRGEEVRAYLESLDEEPEAFVILDDINEFPTYRKVFVQTLERDGLTAYDMETALYILNGVKDVQEEDA